MNINSITRHVNLRTALIAVAFSSLTIAACAVTPESPQGAAEARSKLTALQNNPQLAEHAPLEIREADAAVDIAEQPVSEEDAELGKHRVYIAERKVAIAVEKATTRHAEAQRALLGDERDAARLEARTREVSQARDDADMARKDAAAAQSSKERSAAVASRQAADYQRQIDALEAEITDRGVVLTLGDVLFATDSAKLQGGANDNLNKLVSFLNQYPERQVQIEGHTDSVGSADYNQGLSLRRAESVKHYLSQQGIASQRLSASGIGMDQPVANNDTAMGRQQNRRVEIIIDNPAQPK